MSLYIFKRGIYPIFEHHLFKEREHLTNFHWTFNDLEICGAYFSSQAMHKKVQRRSLVHRFVEAQMHNLFHILQRLCSQKMETFAYKTWSFLHRAIYVRVWSIVQQHVLILDKYVGFKSPR